MLDKLHHAAADVAGRSRSITGFTQALHFDTQVLEFFFIGNKIVIVTGESIELVYQDYIKFLRSAVGRHHLLEFRPFVSTGASRQHQQILLRPPSSAPAHDSGIFPVGMELIDLFQPARPLDTLA